jgi:hypothetical protein
MRKQFLIHKLGEIYQVVDISGVGAHAQFVPSVQFTSWKMLEPYFLKLGATQEAMDKAKAEVDNNGTTRLLI